MTSSPSNKCNKIKGRFLKRLFTVPHFPFFSCLINAPFTFSSLYWTPLSNKCLLFITHPACICSKIPTSFPGFSGNEVAKMLGNSEIEQNHSGSQVFVLILVCILFNFKFKAKMLRSNLSFKKQLSLLDVSVDGQDCLLFLKLIYSPIAY